MRIFTARSKSAARHIQTVSALALCVGVTACAGNVQRFSDNFYTNSVPSRPQAPVQTPYPNQIAPQTNAAMSAPQPIYQPQQTYSVPASPSYDPVATSSVNNAAQGVSRAPLAAPVANPYPTTPANTAAPAIASAPTLAPTTTAAPAPTTVAAAAPVQTPSATATAQPAVVERGEGWTRTGGTYISMRSGETVYNLAKRYGVPANAILEANGISDPTAVQAGQRMLIPVYNFSRTAPNSNPDADPKVMAASSSVGGRSNVPMSSAPTPAARPTAAAAPVAAPATATPPVQSGRYVVEAGDTLYGISRKTGVGVDALKRTNGLTSDSLRVGQSLLVPGQNTNVQQSGITPPPVDRTVTSSTPSAPPAPTKPYTPPTTAANDELSTIDRTSTASAPAATGVKTMRRPVDGRIVSAFGSNVGGKANDGIDISVPQGTAVKAAENGTVIYAGDGLKELGKTILVRHGDGLVTVYGHLSDIKISRGDQISRGQTIAASGMSGSARQPQLHFEVRKDTKPVNPATYLN